MSRATVRTAIVDYFAPGGTPWDTKVGKVFRAHPKQILAAENYAGAGDASGSVAVVVLEREREVRRALGGATSGKKQVFYTCRLDLFFRSVKPDGDDAMDDYDAVVDAVKAKLRADRNLGSPTVVFQAGEDELSAEHGDPVLSNNVIHVWGTVRFVVSEILTT